MQLFPFTGEKGQRSHSNLFKVATQFVELYRSHFTVLTDVVSWRARRQVNKGQVLTANSEASTAYIQVLALRLMSKIN